MRRTQRRRATLASSVHFLGVPLPLGAVLAMLGPLMFASACALLAGGELAPSSSPSDPVSSATPGAEESMTPCRSAPDWLIAAVTAGLAAPGATLSEVYVGAASVTGGPPAVMSPSFASPWWIVAKVNGAGIRPAVAVWVTNRVVPGKAGDIISVNAVALRYSRFGARGEIPVVGTGQETILMCLTPIPES